MDALARSFQHGITRRRVIASGAAGAAAVALPLPLARSAAAAEAPRALRRSTWTALVGDRIACATGLGLEVLAVGDLAHASDRGLAGSEDAFVVSLRGPAGATLTESATRLAHPAFGEATLFVGSVERAAASGHLYELLIDRSLPLAGVTVPVPAPSGEPAVVAPPTGAPSAAERAEVRRYAFLRGARLGRRRGRRVVRLRFAPSADVRRVRIRLERAGRILARGQGTSLHHAAELPLQAAAPLPRGRCDLVVTVVDGTGVRTTARRPVVL